MNILLAGGGTGGSVTALLAIADELKKRRVDVSFVFVGSRYGPECLLAENAKIPFYRINSGKLRRYFDWRNLIDQFRIFHALFQSLILIKKLRPDVILSAGSYIAVPVVWAGKILGVKSMTHQLDINVGLANKLTFPFVDVCTVGCSETVAEIRAKRVIWTGNPYRLEITQGDRSRGLKLFGLNNNLPILLCTGGGTGARRINQLISSAALRLVKRCQVLHITGRGKTTIGISHPNYHVYEFLTKEMKDAYAVADVVISRAGISTLTELGVNAKPGILIPIPNSHQERNAQYFKNKGAAIVLNESLLTDTILFEQIVELIENKQQQASLGEMMKKTVRLDANQKIADEIERILP